MVQESYRRKLEQMTLSELQAELASEQDALKELLDGPRYDDWSRQVQATRDNIDFIKSLI